MKIEQSSIPATTPKTQTEPRAQVSPEVEQLLSQLKVRLGDTVTALVNKVTVITQEEQQQLLQAKTHAATPVQKQSWEKLLSQPTLKLVELTHQKAEFTTITSLPINKGQQLTVLVSAKGLQLLLDGATIPKNSAVTSQLAQAITRPAAEGASPSKPTELPLKPISSPLISATLDKTARSTPAATATSAAHPITLTETQLPKEMTLTAPRPTPERNAASVQAIATAVASALPRAQPASMLLDVNRQLVALLQHVPSQSLPPSLRPLLALLNSLQQQTVELTSNKPVAAATIAKAFTNSGIFHESNALRSITKADEALTQPLNDKDIKALLIRTVEGLSQLNPSQSEPAGKPSLTNDAVARLWLGIVKGLGNKGDSQKLGVSQKENLLLVTQNLAQNSLAKIQMNQYRSLTTTHSDPGTGNQTIHLDIPIKWPDAYGNAYLQIFPPKVTEDDAGEDTPAKTKRQKQMRWRIFMELEMGDEGSLAVELTLADKTVDATFWAEKEQLRQKAAAQLHTLRNELTEEGLLVTDLRCSKNPPPEQKMNIDYAIIDVQT